jgi:hypothetical protein
MPLHMLYVFTQIVTYVTCVTNVTHVTCRFTCFMSIHMSVHIYHGFTYVGIHMTWVYTCRYTYDMGLRIALPDRCRCLLKPRGQFVDRRMEFGILNIRMNHSTNHELERAIK